MEKFDTLQNIDNFCKVLVKKVSSDNSEKVSRREIEPSDKDLFERNHQDKHPEANLGAGYNIETELEEPLVDVFDEEDHVRILVQCRCQEQQVTFHPSKDGITICREECYIEEGNHENCRNICRKLNLPTDGLQLENMLFIIAKCNNNNTLEATISKIKH